MLAAPFSFATLSPGRDRPGPSWLRQTLPDLLRDIGPLGVFNRSFLLGTLDVSSLSEVHRGLRPQIEQAASRLVALRGREKLAVDRRDHRLVRLHLAIHVSLVEGSAGQIRQLAEVGGIARCVTAGPRHRAGKWSELSIERGIVRADAFGEAPRLGRAELRLYRPRHLLLGHVQV